MAEWRIASDGRVPPNAVAGGSDVNGETIYVGRARDSHDTVPGKIVPSHGVCYIPYAGEERAHRTYEYLVTPAYGSLTWRSSADGAVPPGSVHGGTTSSGEPLYVGRAYYEGSWIIGKVQPSHKVLYVPFDGKEVAISDYDVLCAEY